MAGGNIRDIKRRIISVKKTQKITAALKLVAAAKFKKNQGLMYKLRKYSDDLSELLANLIARTMDVNNDLFTPREGKSIFVVLSSDRGLCGGFNQNIFRKVNEDVPAGSDVFAVGNKAVVYYKKSKYNLVGSFTGVSETISIDEIQPLVDRLLEFYTSREYAKVVVIFNEFKSVVVQNIKSEELLPIEISDFKHIEVTEQNEFLFEPGATALIESAAKKYLYAMVQKYLLESGTAEQGSRMTAMESATDNAGDLIYRLTLLYNRARQSAITTELTEIVAGAEGMKS
jgi:F-type H+-transporting ATPase subunit gamma